MRFALSIILLFLLSCTRLFGNEEPVFTPHEWDFGEISSDEVIEKCLRIHNPGSRNAEIDFTSTCDCIYIEPETVRIGPSDYGSVVLRFDPADYSGDIRKYVIIRTNVGSLEKAFFEVRGFVLSGKQSNGDAAAREEKQDTRTEKMKSDGGKEADSIFFEYYYSRDAGAVYGS